ncbi:transposase family protein [Streptomyces calvus]
MIHHSMIFEDGPQVVFAGIGDVVVEAVSAVFGTVEVVARSCLAGAVCPDCGACSSRVHASYLRKLKDLPLGGQGVVILLKVRRFVRGTERCRRRTFAEPFTQLTAPYARFTTRLNQALPLELGFGSPAGPVT